MLATMAAAPAVAQPSASNPQPSQPEAPQGTSLDDMGMPDIGLDWPDLDQDRPAPEPATPQQPTSGASRTISAPTIALPILPATPPSEPDPEALPGDNGDQSDESVGVLATIDPAAPLHYLIELDGIDEAADDTLRTRFDALSELRKGEDDPANVAQIRRRGQADADLLDELLRVRGYYDSRTRADFQPGTSANQIKVRLRVNPGTIYQLGEVDIDGLEAEASGQADLLKLFTVKAGDPADTDKIQAATTALRAGLLDRGYPFSEVREPVLVVDHERRTSRLNLTVTTGGLRRIGKITVNPDAPFDATHVDVIARFSPGDPYKQSDIADLNRALVATGLVSQATITPQQGATDDQVDIAMTLLRAPPRTVAGELGYGTGQGARAEVSWQHRNFFPPEGAMTFRTVLGTQEQAIGAVYRRSNFGDRDRTLNAEASISNLNQPAYDARSAGVSASIERQTNLIFQKEWTWSLGAEVRISDERDFYGADLVPRRRIFVITALPSSVTYDGSDDLLDPKRGFRLGARISPELSLQGGAFGYVRAQFDGSFYIPAGDQLTFAGRGRLGTIVGASRDRIAPTRRFYAGGAASIRGYGYQAIGPRDANNAPIGGRSLGELSFEARYRFGSMNQFGIVPFIDAGTISADPWPSIKEMRVGAGIGVRYYSNFGPIRIDVGTPLNPQKGDSRIGVYVSLGQAF
jgi:translocation and assembly module TamA